MPKIFFPFNLKFLIVSSFFFPISERWFEKTIERPLKERKEGKKKEEIKRWSRKQDDTLQEFVFQ